MLTPLTPPLPVRAPLRADRPPTGPLDDLTAPAPVLALAQEAMNRFQGRLVPLLTAGCWSFVDMVAVMVAGMAGALLLFGLIVAKAPEAVILAAAILVWLGCLGTFLVTMGSTAAAMLRVVEGMLDREEEPSIAAVRGHLPEGLRIGAGTMLVSGLIGIIGMMLCYLPGLIYQLSVPLLLPVRLDRQTGTLESVGICWRYFRAFPGWHAGIFGMNMIIAFIAGSIPFVGYALYVPFHALFLTLAWRSLRRVRLPE